MPLTFQYTFLLIAAGALLIPGRARRLGLLGLVPLGLAVAATTVRLGGEFSDLSLRAAERSAPLGFLQINTGMFLLGIVSVVGAVLAGFPRSPTSWIAVFLVAGGAAPMVAAQVPLLSYIGWLPSLGAALGIGAGAVTLFVVGRLLRLGRGFAWLDARLLEKSPPPVLPAAATTFDLTWAAGFFISLIIAAISPSLPAVALAAVVAGTVGHVLMRRLGGGSPVPVSALFILLLIPVYQFVATIAGLDSLAITQLASQPLSIAAENRILPWLALAAWGCAGLWPLHGLVLPLLASLSGILLVRLGTGAFPGGMDHWAPLFMPLAILSVWHVVGSPGPAEARPRRLIEMLAALAFFGVFAGGEGVTGALWLLAPALLVPWFFYLFRGPTTAGAAGRLVWLPVAWGSLLVVTGGLASQVTYTTLAAGGIAAALWVYHTPE